MIRWYSKVKIVIRYCITAQVLVYVLRRLALNTLNIIPLPSCVIYSRIISPKEIQGPCSILYERSSRGSRIEDRSNPMRKCLLPSPSHHLHHCSVRSLSLLLLTRQHLRLLLALMGTPHQMRNQLVLPVKPPSDSGHNGPWST
jgi:hypothetical protein